MVNYIPQQRDICYMNFDPTLGHEQNDTRPCLIVSTDFYNKYTKMALVCPISSNVKVFPSHYCLKNTLKVKGNVLCEHIRSIDYSYRKLAFVEKLSQDEFDEVIEIIKSFMEKE